MITGFNTDINFDGVTYHVQTEDKGLRTPLILSLVYQRGTILASKRTPYEDLLVGEFDEKLLEDRLNRQHKLICAAIRAGRIEELKKMTLKESSEKASTPSKEVNLPPKEEKVLPKPERVVEKVLQKSEKFIEKAIPKPEIVVEKVPSIITKEPTFELEINEPTLDKTPKEKVEIKPIEPILENKPIVQKEIESKIPKPSDEPVWDIPIVEDVIIIEDEFEDASQVFGEEEIILPPDAVEIIGDLEQFGALLDEELKVKILGESKFKSGDRKNVNILVCRGNDDKAVGDANVMIKVVGSDFRPLIYHTKADDNGVATAFLKLPTFRSGRAAVLVRAMINGEETELRRIITPD